MQLFVTDRKNIEILVFPHHFVAKCNDDDDEEQVEQFVCCYLSLRVSTHTNNTTN